MFFEQLGWQVIFNMCTALKVRAGQPAVALHTLERSRARGLLEQLGQRDLSFSLDIPEELDRRRRTWAGRYDALQSAIARSQDTGETARLYKELEDLRNAAEEIEGAIRLASPRLASLAYARALDLEGIRSALDPGTLLLTYSMGQDEGLLFAVEHGSRSSSQTGIHVFTIPIGKRRLREKVEFFRGLVDRGQLGSTDTAGLLEGARDLYHLLIGPAASLIESSERLLISPEGSLHILPFAALLDQNGRYLVQWKPIHVIVSATVYAELTLRRPENTASFRIAALGDPVYPTLSEQRAEAPRDSEVRAVARAGFALQPLPSTRDEVESIARLFPRDTEAYLGVEATEERAKTVGNSAQVLHFACHGLLDERFPLNSALALTVRENPSEGQDNGLLQAWEIFEQVRLDADLVTLSACDTALGKEMAGEGLIGLTRAFQYAGARSIVASLWSVADESTAVLMERFYSNLKAGMTKDEALRQAQLHLAKSLKYSHPFHWAAFQLIGDWR